MKKVALHNLGCKVNSYETEVMQQKLQEKGYEIVPFDEYADIYIVNTCTVTNMADRKSRQMLHRAKQQNPNGIVVAVGCYVQTGREDVQKDASVDLLIGNNRKKDIVEILEQYMAEVEGNTKDLHDTTVPDINHTYDYEEMQLKQTAEHTRAYIKIQDGCNQFCTYCAIPYARGRVRSRKAEDILREVKGIVEAGYKEIVLTGIHISSYGIDFDSKEWEKGNSVTAIKGEVPEYNGNSKLIDLIEMIHTVEGVERIRISSLEPRVVTEETADRLAALGKICPHFHLSLQSGCDATLKRMNRHYSAGQYLEAVKQLRRAFEQPAITTDVIVGFPGETQEEYEETRRFLEEISFYEMHIFKYSKRAGTVAAKMKDQVPEPVKTTRSNELLQMEKVQSAEYRKQFIGKEEEVLLEDEEEICGKKWRVGHTKRYVKIAVPAMNTEAGMIVKVKPSAFLTEDILV